MSREHEFGFVASEVTPRIAAIVLLRFSDSPTRYEVEYGRALDREQERVIRLALGYVIAKEAPRV